MSKWILIFGIFVGFGLSYVQAQEPDTIQLKKVIELKMNRLGGANGASVAWNPALRRYYCAMAGNAEFPMGVFDASGKSLSDSTLSTLIDVRGFWYNPRMKALQANAYNDFGWVSYKLDSKGMPESFSSLFTGLNQPAEQSVGVYDAVGDALYFLDIDETALAVKYNMQDGKEQNSVLLHLGTADEIDIDDEWEAETLYDYNSTAAIFTGIQGSEIGLLNELLSQVELYNLQDGLVTKVLRFPADAPINEMFNFSYCNKTYWLFDKDARKWIGYK